VLLYQSCPVSRKAKGSKDIIPQSLLKREAAPKKVLKNLKKGLTNEKRCGKIVKHSRGKQERGSQESKAANGFAGTQGCETGP